MSETVPAQRPAPLAPPPPLSYKSAPVAPPAPLEGVDLRFGPAREPGWTCVASIGTASLWHRARDVLTQHQIICRMVSDPADTRADGQRTDLLVMASEAEWARDLLRQGIPELGGSAAFPPGGFPVVAGGMSAAARATGAPPPLPDWYSHRAGLSPAPGARTPVAALPVAPIRPPPSAGQSVAYTITLILAFAALIVVIVITIVVCFIPDFE